MRHLLASMPAARSQPAITRVRCGSNGFLQSDDAALHRTVRAQDTRQRPFHGIADQAPADRRRPERTRLRGGGHAHPGVAFAGDPAAPKRSSTRHASTAARDRAADTDGTTRPVSMALTAGRDSPARRRQLVLATTLARSDMSARSIGSYH